ncbi:MAG: polyhydroxyalkanoate synthesis regulator DNA-binding domain-containing protein [Desulfobacterales bacterium]
MSEIMHQVKKYANGRLYDTTRKKYITMGEIEEFMRTGTAFRIVATKTDEDITDSVIAKLKKEAVSKAEKASGPQTGKKPKVIPKIKAGKKSVSDSEPGPKINEDEAGGILGKMLRMGESTLAGYNQKYADLLHSAMTMAEEEFDKRVKQLIKAKEMSESEAGRVKKDIKGFTRNIKNWVGGNVEERIEEILSGMNLATRDQVEKLGEKINELNKKLELLKKTENSSGQITPKK